MRCDRFLALIVLVGALPAVGVAQKHSRQGQGKYTYSRTTGKGTPAFLAHHKDNSDIILRQSSRNTATAEVNRLEQQSMHASVASTPKTRVRPVGVAKASATKGDKSAPINFSGRNPKQSLTTTRSSGRSAGTTPAKPH